MRGVPSHPESPRPCKDDPPRVRLRYGWKLPLEVRCQRAGESSIEKFHIYTSESATGSDLLATCHTEALAQEVAAMLTRALTEAKEEDANV